MLSDAPYRTTLRKNNIRTFLSDNVFLFLLVVAQLFINDGWAYSPVGWIDPWFYVGYAFHYLDPNFYNDYYKVSRLPWVLTEFLVRQTIPNFLATWCLHVLTLMIGAASCYGLFRGIFGRTTGLVTSSFFAICTFAHSIGGGDYHSEMSGALFLLTWYLAFHAAAFSANHLLSMFAIGFFGALTVHTSVLFVNLAPYVFAHWYLTSLQKTEHRPPIFRFGVAASVGGLSSTVALSIINWSAGRGFWFFVKQFSLAANFVMNSTNQTAFWHPWSSGFYWPLGYCGLLVGGALAALFGLLEVAGARSNQKTKQRLFLSIGYLLCFAGWIAWQTAGQTALDWDYFAYPLLFPLLGVIAVFVSHATERAKPIPSIISYPLLMIGLLGPLFGGMSFYYFFANSGYSMLVTVAAQFLATMLALVVVRPPVLAFAVGIPLFGITSLSTTPGPQSVVYSHCATERDWQSIIVQSHKLIVNLQPDHRRILVWFDNQPSNQLGTEVVRDNCNGAEREFQLFGFSLVNTGFSYLGDPPWHPRSIQDLDERAIRAAQQSRALIIYVSADPKRISLFKARFDEIRASISVASTHEVRSGSSMLPLTVFAFAE